MYIYIYTCFITLYMIYCIYCMYAYVYVYVCVYVCMCMYVYIYIICPLPKRILNIPKSDSHWASSEPAYAV